MKSAAESKDAGLKEPEIYEEVTGQVRVESGDTG